MMPALLLTPLLPTYPSARRHAVPRVADRAGRPVVPPAALAVEPSFPESVGMDNHTRICPDVRVAAAPGQEESQ